MEKEKQKIKYHNSLPYHSKYWYVQEVTKEEKISLNQKKRNRFYKNISRVIEI